MNEGFISCCVCDKQASIAEDIGEDTYAFCGDECYNEILDEYQLVGVNVTKYLKKFKRVLSSSKPKRDKDKSEKDTVIEIVPDEKKGTFTKYQNSKYYTDDDGKSIGAVKLDMKLLNTTYKYVDHDGLGFNAFRTTYKSNNRTLGDLTYANFEQSYEGGASDILAIQKQVPHIKYLFDKPSEVEFTIDFNGIIFNVILKLTGEIKDDVGKYIYVKDKSFLVIEIQRPGIHKLSASFKDSIDITRVEYYKPTLSPSTGKIIYKDAVPFV